MAQQPNTDASPEPIAADREASLLSDIRQLTFGDRFDRAGEAYFHPKNGSIIFQAVPKGEKHYQMYVLADPLLMGSEAGEARIEQISATPSRNTCGWFSPDGNTILFASTFQKEIADEPTAGYQREGRDYRWAYPSGMELWTREPIDGKGNENQGGFAVRTLTDNAFYDAEGSFSPDGKHIVFTSNRTGDLELFSMKRDGTSVVQLTTTPGYDGGPFFSPDGKRVCYRSDRMGNNLLQVFVSDVVFDDDGEITGLANEMQLTEGADVNWGPFWHPTGKWIAWATSKHGHANYEIYIMRDDGSDKTRVTYAAGADVLPAFSPDGKHMLWSGKRSGDNTTQVYVAKFKLPDER